MRPLLAIFFACAGCSAADVVPLDTAVPERMYATQTSAPSPDYRTMLDRETKTPGSSLIREASGSPPANAKAVGEVWLERLQGRKALLGYGRSRQGQDAPVDAIDTGLTLEEFDNWTRENGWSVPAHIRWGFVSALKLPEVSTAAEGKVRVWPASTARTGMQLQALHGGRIELRDGCFFTGAPGQPADKLAWFHAEIGLDIDTEGYYVLRDRVDSSTLARLGEEMNWAGPASAAMDDDRKRALLEACGPAEIMVVGSPQSRVRFQAQYPHSR